MQVNKQMAKQALLEENILVCLAAGVGGVTSRRGVRSDKPGRTEGHMKRIKSVLPHSLQRNNR